MIYSILAELVVFVHFLFIVFAVSGAILALKWRWIIYVHLLCAAWASLIMMVGWICPLTPLENSLRRSAGEAGYTDGFIDHYLMPIIYPAGLTREIQIWLGVGVVLINLLLYGFVFYRRYYSKRVTE
jgi:hypothetical protein